MSKRKKNLSSKIGWSTTDQITVHGLNMPEEILGHFSVGDFAFLLLTGRSPTPDEARIFNALFVTLIEHGITPSAMVARLTYMGAPEALQSAVAAGLCGLGTVFVGSMEGAAKLLSEALPENADSTGKNLGVLAKDIVTTYRSKSQIIPGLGHPLHKPIDPRTPRLFELASETGFSGRYVDLMQCVQAEAEAASGKELPINATGAIGAICCELGLPWSIVRGIGVMARSIGLVGHILEEQSNPMAFELWQRTEEEILANGCGNNEDA